MSRVATFMEQMWPPTLSIFLETDKAGLLLQEVLDIEILNIEIVTAS
jgi:hypothetical protein